MTDVVQAVCAKGCGYKAAIPRLMWDGRWLRTCPRCFAGLHELVEIKKVTR